MKKILVIPCIGMAIFMLTSCAEDSLPENSAPGKDTQMQLKSVAAYPGGLEPANGTLSGFTNGDTIGLYLDGYRLGNPFVFAARENYGWQLPEPVFLSDKPIGLVAYSPYRHSEHANLSEKAVYVEHASQTDYMYGPVNGGYVSRERPCADIEMKHALALVQFKFIRNGYPHDCSVQRVSIQNADGITLLKSRGRLDLESGQVDSMEGYYDGAAITPEDMNFYDTYTGEQEYASILVMPIGPVRNNGDLFFGFEIDGHMYTWPVKAGTYWQQGMKYTYEVEMVPAARSTKASGITADVNIVLTQTSSY